MYVILSRGVSLIKITSHVKLKPWFVFFFTDYLFVVRDPLARMLSDYNYERPNITEAKPYRKSWNEHELYIDCKFWTLEGELGI